MEVSMEPKSFNVVSAILRSLFPDLAVRELSLLGEGWDSIAILVNDYQVFRIPKRPVVARQMAKEIQVLAAVHPYVSARVPNIEWIGPAREHLLVSAVGYRKLVGEPFLSVDLGDGSKHVLEKIARFLNELHAVPADVLSEASVPWFRWTGDNSLNGTDSWEAGLRDFTDRILIEVVPLLSRITGHRVSRVITAYLEEANHFEFQPVLLHGDFSPEHILVDDETGEISVIDFGDCGLGDPAYDVWPTLTSFYHGMVDESFALRQRFYRKMAPFHGALYGLMMKDEVLVTDGLRHVEEEFSNL